MRFAEFAKALARVLKRPCLPVGPPDALLKIVLGEVAQVVVTGQKVLPGKALALGYSYKYADVLEALRAIFAPPKVAAPAAVPHDHGHAAAHH